MLRRVRTHVNSQTYEELRLENKRPLLFGQGRPESKKFDGVVLLTGSKYRHCLKSNIPQERPSAPNN